MNRFIDLIIGIIIIAVLWWAFTSILALVPLVGWIKQILYILGVLVVVFAIIDWFRVGPWWRR